MSAVVSSNGLSDVTGLDGSTWLFHRGRADLKHATLPFYTNTELRSRVNKNAANATPFCVFFVLPVRPDCHSPVGGSSMSGRSQGWRAA